MQRAITRLRTLVERGDFLELPSAYDPLATRLAQGGGFIAGIRIEDPFFPKRAR